MIKTPQSDRKIPIHPFLIKLGFLGYVEAQRSAGKYRVFPQPGRDPKRGRLRTYIGKHF